MDRNEGGGSNGNNKGNMGISGGKERRREAMGNEPEQHDKEAARKEMGKEKRKMEKEQRNGGWGFRDTMRRTKEKEEPGWLWLATEAPRARGERDAAEMVTEARKKGVRGAEEKVGESRDQGKREIRRRF